METSDRSDIKGDRLIEHDKRIGINEIIKPNKRINNNLNSQS